MHSERCTVLAHGNGSFPAYQLLTLGPSRPLSEMQQAQKQMTQSPSCSLLK